MIPISIRKYHNYHYSGALFRAPEISKSFNGAVLRTFMHRNPLDYRNHQQHGAAGGRETMINEV